MMRTAIHEAAHACVGRVFELPCGGATIIPDATGRDGWSPVTTACTMLSSRAAAIAISKAVFA
jgi:hypothetical protein